MAIEVSDPRPVLEGNAVMGARCTVCGHASAWRVERCERCRGACRAVAYGPGGEVWSSAAVHLQVGDRVPPFVLAYVDLVGADGGDGPRVLARVGTGEELSPGTMVRISVRSSVRSSGSDAGDITVEPTAGGADDRG